MKKFISFFITILLTTSCTFSDLEEPVQESVDNFTDLAILEEKLLVLEAENNDLKKKIEEFEDVEEDLWARVKEAQADRDKAINSDRVTSERVQTAYNISLAYRNDIRNMFELFGELNYDMDSKFSDLDYLTDEQKNAVISGAEEYLELIMDWNEEQYETEEYVGEKPYPFNLHEILGIVEEDPMFHFGVDESKTLHFKVYYYKSEVMTGSEDGQPVLDFRGPFAGVSAIHLVIEEIDGEWTTTYAGIG